MEKSCGGRLAVQSVVIGGSAARLRRQRCNPGKTRTRECGDRTPDKAVAHNCCTEPSPDFLGGNYNSSVTTYAAVAAVVRRIVSKRSAVFRVAIIVGPLRAATLRARRRAVLI